MASAEAGKQQGMTRIEVRTGVSKNDNGYCGRKEMKVFVEQKTGC